MAVQMDIPVNPLQRDFEAEVADAIAHVLSEMGTKPGHRSGGLSLNHGQSHFHVLDDVAAEVARRFKEKGYYAHYCHSVRGVIHTLEITTYPTNNDI